MSTPEKLRPDVSTNLPASDKPTDTTDVRTKLNMISVQFISVFIYCFFSTNLALSSATYTMASACSVLNA